MTTELLEPPHSPEETVIEKNGRYYEWIDGEWVERSMGAESSLIGFRILLRAGSFAEAHRLGLAFPADVGYQIFPQGAKPVRYGDGSFICSGRLPDDKPPKGHIKIAPDMFLEVISPNDLAYEVEQKVTDYLRVGVRLLWVVYPNTRTIMVYRSGGQGYRLTETDQLTGEDVLPGFTCSVAELFAGI